LGAASSGVSAFFVTLFLGSFVVMNQYYTISSDVSMVVVHLAILESEKQMDALC